MPTTTPTPQPPLLPALLLLLSTGTYTLLEHTAWQSYDLGQDQDYDWKIESLSDLGVDYRQVHPLKHYNITSYASQAMNGALMQAGIVFALVQSYLLWDSRGSATRRTALARTLRLVLSLVYAAGMVLFAWIHGGPRERFWGIVGWHWTGFSMAGVGGNLCLILVAVVATTGGIERDGLYRVISAGLGGVGLYSFWRFGTLGGWDYQTQLGLWQRGTVYPVLAWNVVTAVFVVAARVGGGEVRRKRV